MSEAADDTRPTPSRYSRALTPFIQPEILGQIPGEVHSVPTEAELRAGETDPTTAALEQGITHTASLKYVRAMGRMLAEKLAHGEQDPMLGQEYPQPDPSYGVQQPYYPQYDPYNNYGGSYPQPYPQQQYEPEQQQYSQALQQSKAAPPSSLMNAIGAGVHSVTHGVGAAATHLKNFVEAGAPHNVRWGSGARPAAFTNEYGVPIKT